MNRWAPFLADLPASLQRAIARAQRVSLPHVCPAHERLRRLRRALCRPAAVRAAYANLDAPTRAALQTLRERNAPLSPAEVTACLGPLRSPALLAADPRPRSVAERLLLLGWLLPRPPGLRHPARYVLAPELRRWLPSALSLPDLGPASAPPRPAALRATEALLLALVCAPLPLRADGSLATAALRRLVPLLAPLSAVEACAALSFVWPLLLQLGLACAAGRSADASPAAASWLARPAHARLDALRAAWHAAPQPDAWLRSLLLDARGIDWPCLRRRLCVWAEALPVGRLLAPAGLYAALVATLGPLANAQTHGFRSVARAPWQPSRAESIWLAALRGPLAWLGEVAWDQHGQLARHAEPPDAVAPCPWRYALGELLVVPEGAIDANALRLARYAEPVGTQEAGVAFRLTPELVARAGSAGHAKTALIALLTVRAGPLPPALTAWLDTSEPAISLAPGVLLIAPSPAVLSRVAQSRSVRRHLGTRLAPDLALVDPAHVAPLARALERQGVSAQLQAPAAAAAPVAELMPGERAALLAACAFYRSYAPPDAPLLPTALLEHRLSIGLPEALREAVTIAVAELAPAQPPTAADAVATLAAPIVAEAAPASAAPERRTPVRELLPMLSQAIARRGALQLSYLSPDEGPSQRTVRPLELERRGGVWYLRAYCTLRGAERTFRLDRMRQLGPPTGYQT